MNILKYLSDRVIVEIEMQVSINGGKEKTLIIWNKYYRKLCKYNQDYIDSLNNLGINIIETKERKHIEAF